MNCTFHSTSSTFMSSEIYYFMKYHVNQYKGFYTYLAGKVLNNTMPRALLWRSIRVRCRNEMILAVSNLPKKEDCILPKLFRTHIDDHLFY